MCRVQLRPSSSRTSAVGDRPPQSISIIERAVELEQAMTMRTTKSTVTFVRPFRLGAFGEQLPAGRYPIETDEELLEGMSFPAYQRTATMMQLMLGSPAPRRYGDCHGRPPAARGSADDGRLAASGVQR